jgi:exopolysaccharide biosynthesis polyprenyl glycosylphosphotransferase
VSWLELHHNKILDFDGLPAVRRQDESCHRMEYRFIKRSFDLAVSGILLVLLSPLMLLIAIAIKVTSREKILFTQKRVGLGGREFDIIKFRTMKKTAENPSQIIWSENNGSHVTPLGKFLRRFNLDELPQLLNVMRGDMSLVGPRPEQPHWIELFSRQIPDYDLRHRLQAGITGWAQVNGWRGATSIYNRTECDLYYLRHWSLWFDLKILMLTLSRGFQKRKDL